MKTFVIKFSTGMTITEQAARCEFEPPKLVLFDADDNVILTYQDSQIVACEEAD